MRKLDRGQVPAPKVLARLKAANRAWKNLTPDERAEIREALSALQRPGPDKATLCAYCESPLRLEQKDSYHIEHFTSRQHAPQRTFDWDNLFLSCSNPNSCGSHKDSKKGKPYDPNHLIKPDQDRPTEFLRYQPNGEVRPQENVDSEDARWRATETIRVFNLNDEKLKGWRQSLFRNLSLEAFQQFYETLASLYPVGGLAFDEELAAELETFLQDFEGEPLQEARRQILLGT